MDQWPVEPPLAGGLGRDGLGTTVGASSLTLGGLLKHLAAVEALSIPWDAFHEDPGEPWRSHDWEADPAWPFTSAADDTPEQLYELYDTSVARGRQRLAEAMSHGGLDQLTIAGFGEERASLRRMVTDLIEEYGRHTGHADLIREAVDGRVGEDPPNGWQPEGPPPAPHRQVAAIHDAAPTEAEDEALTARLATATAGSGGSSTAAAGSVGADDQQRP